MFINPAPKVSGFAVTECEKEGLTLSGAVLFILMVITPEGRAVVRVMYDRYVKGMLYVACKILGPERSEDAVYDVFVSLLERYDEEIEVLLNKPCRFFLVTVKSHAKNLREREHRERRYESMRVDDGFELFEREPESVVLEGEAEERLARLLLMLREPMRRILELKYIEGYGNSEIASMLGITQSAVSSRLERARRRLRELLESGEGG